MIQESGETLSKGKSVIDRVGEKLNVDTETIQKAKEIYTQAVAEEDCTFTGRSVETVAGTCILIASRKTGDIRTANEIATVVNETNKTTHQNIHQTHKYICHSLNLGFVLADPNDFLDRICEKLPANEADAEKAKEILNEVKDHDSQVNTSARTMAAAAIYLAGTDEDRHGEYTQQEIGDIVDVSTLTIRQNYRDLKEIINTE